MESILSISILIILAIITQYIVAWAGSVLHSVGSEEAVYAVFTFKDDRYMPMTTNILMNVCIPNIIMIFAFVVVRMLGMVFIEKYLIVMVISFYVYRMFLICVLLRRKEMYTWPYEIGIAVSGVLLAYFLIHFFFTTDKTVIITADELREELWFVIIIILYQFFKMILDKKVTQNKVLTKGQITKYVIHKFNKFYLKYNDLLEINIDNRYLCIFLYAVMIFEDYNRGPYVRMIERAKIHITKKATLGIMQMPTNNSITDEESITKFYNWLEQQTEAENQFERNEAYIKQLAWQHNNDEDYAKSVTYIYNCLWEYINEVPRYRKAFHIREDITDNDEVKEYSIQLYKKVKVSSAEEFSKNLKCDTFIEFEVGKYNVLEGVEDSNYISRTEVHDGYELMIRNLNHIYVNGNGAELYTEARYAQVLHFKDCENIIIDNLILGHSPQEAECCGSVLKFENCHNVQLRNLKLFGCGVYGIEFFHGNVNIQKCRIYSCSGGAVLLENVECLVFDLEVFDCIDIFDSLITAINGNLILSNVKIHNNTTKKFIFYLDNINMICENVDVYDNQYTELANHRLHADIDIKNNCLFTEEALG